MFEKLLSPSRAGFRRFIGCKIDENAPDQPDQFRRISIPREAIAETCLS
jgi:hypothetical protein